MEKATEHLGKVISVDISPDGERWLSLGRSTDSNVRLTDAASNRVLRRFQAQDLCGWQVRFSPDGDSLISGSDDRTIRRWDLASGAGEQIAEHPGRQAFKTAVEAAMTVTFIGRKRGLYTGQGPDLAGRVLFDGLQVPDQLYQQVPADARLLTGPPMGPLAMPHRRSAHKGDFGHVLIIGGDLQALARRLRKPRVPGVHRPVIPGRHRHLGHMIIDTEHLLHCSTSSVDELVLGTLQARSIDTDHPDTGRSEVKPRRCIRSHYGD